MSTEMLNDYGKNIPTDIPAVTQSKFFSPAFNAAIFDGPLRIYFAQYQEPEALKIYFKIQEKLNSTGGIKSSLKKRGSNVFIMLYPTNEIFNRSFDGEDAGKDENLAGRAFGKDFILGLNGQTKDMDCELIYDRLTQFTLPNI